MLIINAVIHTMEEQGIIEDAYLLTENDKIKKIGKMQDLDLKDECTIDAQGANLYPGFVDSHTHLGMWEDGINFEGDDGNEDTDPYSPQLRAIDAVNSYDRCFQEACKAGITSVVTGPGSANPIGGQMLAMKTSGRYIDEMVIKFPVAIKMALGENPKNVYHGKGETPVTRMATAAIIREQLFKAKRYYEDITKAQQEQEDLPEFDIKCEALLGVVKKEIPIHFHCHRRDDIITAIRIAEEFDVNYILVHATEGYLIADILKEKDCKVMSGPILCDRSKPELKNLTPKSVPLLASSGILSSIVTDHPVIPIQYLPLTAALAVKEGLSQEQALKAITIIPAKMCGLDDRIGSIKVGKDADFTLFSDNPLSVLSKPKMVVISGKVVEC